VSEHKEKWIQRAIRKPGALRKQLGAKEDETLSHSEVEKASRQGGKIGKRAKLALLLRRFHSARKPTPPPQS
jgi:hypothetical protein